MTSWYASTSLLRTWTASWKWRLAVSRASITSWRSIGSPAAIRTEASSAAFWVSFRLVTAWDRACPKPPDLASLPASVVAGTSGLLLTDGMFSGWTRIEIAGISIGSSPQVRVMVRLELTGAIGLAADLEGLLRHALRNVDDGDVRFVGPAGREH